MSELQLGAERREYLPKFDELFCFLRRREVVDIDQERIERYDLGRVLVAFARFQ